MTSYVMWALFLVKMRKGKTLRRLTDIHIIWNWVIFKMSPLPG